MATKRHPVTRVLVNDIEIRRKRLGPIERLTAELLRRDGNTIHDIAHMLGTHHSVICNALRRRPFDADQLQLI
ncbi:MAG: hypothetical protein BGP11_06160 [Rhodobacterales bacterium 65-51]|uniref:helix-turn-helix domain-containing protein n=1 Tax=uncultured Gemmobacter sp. TaxID=1095917 RepID=UPI00095AEB74|nr:helix-turn-helix domain-containing protein [uncultured Gemmobacter sp.]OJY25367.1 MAG: hypothetical protein BGP11_06160 [Rhodobacterales bacterium 65-51]